MLLLAALAVVLGAACSGDDAGKGPRQNDSAGPATGGPAASNVAGGSGVTPAGKPNVVFVLTDDMRFDDMQYLPHIRELIGDQGVTFDNEFDNVTLCCPARTSILRGQYSHNTGVLTNGGGNGGFETAHKENVEKSTIATAMHDAGYTTALFGKYLNGYPNTAGDGFIPPGWDNWASSIKGNAYGEYNYTLNENGKPVQYGKKPEDYGTSVYLRQAKDVIDKAAKSHKPFFVYLAVYAPHQPATPAPEDERSFPGLQAPRDPAFNEADISDKPQYIRNLPLLNARQLKNIDNLYRLRAQSLQAVDRAVVELVDQLRSNGQLENTYIVFTSDNGFHLGQHRMQAGKQTAYETDIHLPLLVRGPGVPAGAHVAAITGNIDLAPTIAALGKAAMKDNPDGRSLLPFLTGKPGNGGVVAAPANWREAYLLEHWTQKSIDPVRPNGVETEPDDPDQGGITPGDDMEGAPTPAPKGKGALDEIPEFQGLRVAGYTYVEYSTGERELYDIVRDPEELNNMAKAANAALIDALHQRLNELRKCAGEACRSAESKPLKLPG